MTAKSHRRSTERRNQEGFTLIELMIVVAIIGILAAIAIPAFQDNATRAKVSEGVQAVGTMKTSVADYYWAYGSLPTSNAAAGLDTNTNYATGVVKQIDIGAGGAVKVTFKPLGGIAAGADAIEFVPTVGASGQISWTCNGTGSTLPSKFRPGSCR